MGGRARLPSRSFREGSFRSDRKGLVSADANGRDDARPSHPSQRLAHRLRRFLPFVGYAGNIFHEIP